MSIYDTIAFSEMTFERDMFWTDISALAYDGDFRWASWIIAFNVNDIDEVDRHSLYISKKYTLKVPVLSQEFEDNSNLPSWRSSEDVNTDF